MRPTAEAETPVTAAHPIAANRLRWLELLSKYRQPIGLAVTLLLFGVALIACRHLLSELDIYALHDSLLSVPAPALGGAFVATIAGFVILLIIQCVPVDIFADVLRDITCCAAGSSSIGTASNLFSCAPGSLP
jgi:hypothetical protein